jgi:hypothetical protein
MVGAGVGAAPNINTFAPIEKKKLHHSLFLSWQFALPVSISPNEEIFIFDSTVPVPISYSH